MFTEDDRREARKIKLDDQKLSRVVLKRNKVGEKIERNRAK